MRAATDVGCRVDGSNINGCRDCIKTALQCEDLVAIAVLLNGIGSVVKQFNKARCGCVELK